MFKLSVCLSVCGLVQGYARVVDACSGSFVRTAYVIRSRDYATSGMCTIVLCMC
jgi:hypothetical protein